MRNGNSRISSLFLHVFALLAAGCGQDASPESTSGQAKQAAQASQLSASELLHRAVEQQDWRLAEGRIEAALIASPSDVAVIEDVARVKAFTGKRREAALMLVDAARLANYSPGSRVQFAIRALIEEGELYSAIDLLEKAVQAKPEQHELRRTLLGFLGEAERYDKVPEHLRDLIKARRVDVPLLIAVTENSVRRFSDATIETMLKRNPNDHRVRLGTVRQSFSNRDVDAAERVLTEILQRHPKFAPAHAMLGQVLLEDRRFSEVSAWAQRAPQESKTFATYWIAVGDFAAETDQPHQAARAYWEATRRDPNNSTAWSRLTQTLRSLITTDPSINDLVSEEQLGDMESRINTLLELRKRFYVFSGGERSSQAEATNIADSLFRLGRNWEAEAWSAIATQLTEAPAENLAGLRRQIIGRLQKNQDWISSTWSPALQADLSTLPLPSLTETSDANVADKNRLIPGTTSAAHLKYDDQANEWGLEDLGTKSNPLGEPFTVIRTTGAGAGAIDFDLDGIVDFVAVGGGGSFDQQNSQPNELMRNLGGEFKSATHAANVVDQTFGQGIAVGDYNEDGFPDMFFANLGTNRLYRNNGDGTFTDRTEDLNEKLPAESTQRGVVQWSTCGSFADTDADGITDLVITNYCELDKTFDESPSQTTTKDGDPTNFHPLDFPAQKDAMFRAAGDGTFTDRSAAWTENLSQGRGLGVVAGKFDGMNMGIYVANDMSANNFVSLPTGSDSVSPLDSAAATGLAVDARTLTQASMGIANGDFDGDGDLDFYVSGFAREYNIYYEQVSPGLWVDRTNRLGLVKPTLMMVGFGAEAIDMDNDGIDELVVTNGNIGSFIDPKGVPYEQPLQIFRRGVSGKFDLVDDDSWGKYFATPHVGRALFSADFNRDGHVDVLITQKHEPVSLLINKTTDSNHRIAFRLVATDASRDGVGAIVRFDCGNRKRTVWAMSGDGYMCSNEKVLRAGLGDAKQVENVTVTWRDGSVDQFGTLNADQRYLLVQHADEAFKMEAE